MLSTLSGRRVALSMAEIRRDELLVARMVCWGQSSSNSANTSRLIANCSGTDSITNPAWDTPACNFVEVWIRLRMGCRSSGVIFPFSSQLASSRE